MMVSTFKVIAMTAAAIVIFAIISVAKGTIIASVLLILMS